MLQRCVIPFLKLSVLTFLLLWITPSYTEELRQGLKYWKISTPEQQTVHILEVDPSQLNITAAHAKETAQGRETVASIAKRYQAIAAINGGFFRKGEEFDGLPAGILKIQGRWYGIAYRPRAAIGWSNKINAVFIDRIQTKTSLSINHRKYPVHVVNQPGSINKSVLYTDTYGKTAGSVNSGYDIVIQNDRIVDIQTAGKTPIPEGGFVYSIGAKAKFPTHPLNIGDPAKVEIEVIPQSFKAHQLGWQLVDNIIGGTPLLLRNGRVINDYTQEHLHSPFIMDRHARTAVGIQETGHWMFVVVEQNAFTGSLGMTIPELAHLMLKLGCVFALNLDGGGSSTLYINNNDVNHPQGDEDEDFGIQTPRPISDAILILPKKDEKANKENKENKGGVTPHASPPSN